MSDCYFRIARGWAIGLLAMALAISIVAIGIGTAMKISYHKNNRICQQGHDQIVAGSRYDKIFLCDEWTPDPNRK